MAAQRLMSQASSQPAPINGKHHLIQWTDTPEYLFPRWLNYHSPSYNARCCTVFLSLETTLDSILGTYLCLLVSYLLNLHAIYSLCVMGLWSAYQFMFTSSSAAQLLTVEQRL